MHELIQSPYASDTLLKVVTALMSCMLAGFLWLIRAAWSASKKVTEVDGTLKEHAAAAGFHASNDEREFSIIAAALKDHGEKFGEIRNKFHDQNSSLQKLTTSFEVQQTHIEYIVKGIDDIKARIK
jgi:hypothetical protein